MRTTFLLLPFLAACQTAPTQTLVPSEDGCGAASYAAVLGAPLAATSFPQGLNMRIIMPDQAVTTDYDADRINLNVDANGIIRRVTCG